jgi:C4-dicarboxylate-specific signal transduction histidine kinase
MGAMEQKSPPFEKNLLRLRAEDLLSARVAGEFPAAAEEKSSWLTHELTVHQLELEMQNAELRQARDSQEAALDRYSALYEFAPVGYLTLDRSGVIRAMNLRGASLLRVERAKLVGHDFVHSVAVFGRPLFRAFLELVFSTTEKASCEIALAPEGGLPGFLQVEAVVDLPGESCNLAILDITDRKRSEQVLTGTLCQSEELNRYLDERVKQATAELLEKQKMLVVQDRHAVMGEMINSIAHQWRQPLDTLGLIIQKLPLFYGSEDFTREYLENNTARAMNLVHYLSRTIDDFRNFFRTDKEAISFGLNQVVEFTVSLIEQSFLDQQIRIVCRLDEGLTVFGYPGEFSQVLMNILMNARDTLEQRRVAEGRITLCGFREEGMTVLNVTDNAGGIPVDIIEKVFDPYFSTKGPSQGSGIGLFMSKTIIEKNMGGRLSASNVVGGARLSIEVHNGD